MAAVSGEKSPNFSYDRPEPGGLPYKRDDVHRRLALGCKLLILVSLRVFGMGSHLHLPVQVSLNTVRKEHTHIGLP